MWQLAVLALAALSAARPAPSCGGRAQVSPDERARCRASLDHHRRVAEVQRIERLLAPLRKQLQVLQDRGRALTATIQTLAARNTEIFEAARTEGDRAVREVLHNQIGTLKKRKTELIAERASCRQEESALTSTIRDLERRIHHMERK